MFPVRVQHGCPSHQKESEKRANKSPSFTYFVCSADAINDGFSREAWKQGRHGNACDPGLSELGGRPRQKAVLAMLPAVKNLGMLSWDVSTCL